MERSIVDEHFPELRSLKRRAARAASDFFFAPASARPLAALRIGVAGVLLAQAWQLRAEAFDFLASDGIVRGDLARSLSPPGAPTVAWIAGRLAPLGLGETQCIQILCLLYVASLLFLAAGFFTRLSAAASWLLNWTLVSSAYAMHYGVDHYAHIFLHYLMWVPAGRALSLDVALGRTSAEPSATARLGLRVVQLHLCLSYLASGIEKAAGSQWWDGEVIWRALSLPLYRQLDMSWLARWPVICQLASLTALAIKLGYCVFIWPRRTRRPWVLATVALHLGIAVLLGMQIFGAMLCVLTLALFGFSAAPTAQVETSLRAPE